MPRLEEASWGDLKARWQLVTTLPENENGFVNEGAGCTLGEFREQILPAYREKARSRQREYTYFLWEGHRAVGIFRLCCRLSSSFDREAGHINFVISPGCRGRGLATAGLALLLEKARLLVPEKELHLSLLKSNLASLRVQQKNGAYIHHEDQTKYYTRIPK